MPNKECLINLKEIKKKDLGRNSEEEVQMLVKQWNKPSLQVPKALILLSMVLRQYAPSILKIDSLAWLRLALRPFQSISEIS
jgi:hypothetical protein